MSNDNCCDEFPTFVQRPNAIEQLTPEECATIIECVINNGTVEQYETLLHQLDFCALTPEQITCITQTIEPLQLTEQQITDFRRVLNIQKTVAVGCATRQTIVQGFDATITGPQSATFEDGTTWEYVGTPTTGVSQNNPAFGLLFAYVGVYTHTITLPGEQSNIAVSIADVDFPGEFITNWRADGVPFTPTLGNGAVGGGGNFGTTPNNGTGVFIVPIDATVITFDMSLGGGGAALRTIEYGGVVETYTCQDDDGNEELRYRSDDAPADPTDVVPCPVTVEQLPPEALIDRFGTVTQPNIGAITTTNGVVVNNGEDYIQFPDGTTWADPGGVNEICPAVGGGGPFVPMTADDSSALVSSFAANINPNGDPAGTVTDDGAGNVRWTNNGDGSTSRWEFAGPVDIIIGPSPSPSQSSVLHHFDNGQVDRSEFRADGNWTYTPGTTTAIVDLSTAGTVAIPDGAPAISDDVDYGTFTIEGITFLEIDALAQERYNISLRVSAAIPAGTACDQIQALYNLADAGEFDTDSFGQVTTSAVEITTTNGVTVPIGGLFVEFPNGDTWASPAGSTDTFGTVVQSAAAPFTATNGQYVPAGGSYVEFPDGTTWADNDNCYVFAPVTTGPTANPNGSQLENESWVEAGSFTVDQTQSFTVEHTGAFTVPGAGAGLILATSDIPSSTDVSGLLAHPDVVLNTTGDRINNVDPLKTYDIELQAGQEYWLYGWSGGNNRMASHNFAVVCADDTFGTVKAFNGITPLITTNGVTVSVTGQEYIQFPDGTTWASDGGPAFIDAVLADFTADDPTVNLDDDSTVISPDALRNILRVHRQGSVEVGTGAGAGAAGAGQIFVGNNAGAGTQAESSIAVGANSAQNAEGARIVAVGNNSARGADINSGVAVGQRAGFEANGGPDGAGGTNPTLRVVFVGDDAGRSYVGSGETIGIGFRALNGALGQNRIALGTDAGRISDVSNSFVVGAPEFPTYPDHAAAYAALPAADGTGVYLYRLENDPKVYWRTGDIADTAAVSPVVVKRAQRNLGGDDGATGFNSLYTPDGGSVEVNSTFTAAGFWVPDFPPGIQNGLVYEAKIHGVAQGGSNGVITLVDASAPVTEFGRIVVPSDGPFSGSIMMPLSVTSPSGLAFKRSSGVVNLVGSDTFFTFSEVG